LRKQAKLLAEHVAGVRLGEDSECIHRARVASRRIRAVLTMFGGCWKRKRVKFWKKRVRGLARDLSEARDHDVQIEFLAARLAGVSDAALVPGIARLLCHVEQQRQWSQPRVLRAVERLEQSGVLKDMQAAARKRVPRRVLDRTNDAAPCAAARRRAVKSVRKRLSKLLTLAPGLANAEQHDQHHTMRIAAKRLRYALELARPRQPSEIDPLVDIIKRLQTLLGEVHDCDVWAENLSAFARTEAVQVYAFFGESRRFDRLRPGLDCLRNDRKARREQVFGELVAFWQELTEKRLWERLIDLLETGGSAGPSDSGAAAVAEVTAAD
jgi:CHAD domain-containing protein